MRKILLTTFGSYGDLHPYIAMARVLKANGDEVTIATHIEYRDQVERIGVKFAPLKPGLEELGPQEIWAKHVNHSIRGTQFIVQTVVMPYLKEAYEVTKEAAVGHDLIISHVLCFASPLVADELGIPWISVILQPAAFFSAYDPPALGFLTFLPKLKFLGPKLLRWTMNTLALPTRAWLTPLDNLRRELRLPPSSKNVLVESFSPHGTLALFSKALSPPQPDWPDNTWQVGFPFFDEETTNEISPELKTFLDSGPPPIVFTLGTAVVMMETPYFEIAYQAMKAIGLRAVFLVGKVPIRIPVAATTDPQIHISAYEPFSKLFPHAAAIVHQCGVGTTAQALVSGRPQVLVPFAHDQPDNARRVVEMGCGVSIRASRLSVARLIKAVRTVTESASFAERARLIVAEMQIEGFDKRLLEMTAQFPKITR